MGCEHAVRCARRDRRREVTTIDTSLSPICRRSSFRSNESTRLRDALPELPEARRERYRREHAALTDYDIEVLTASAAMGDYFEQVARQCGDPKTAANWMMGEVLAALKSTGQAIDQFGVRPADLAALIVMVRDGVVSHSAAKQVFASMVADRRSPGGHRGARRAAQGHATTSR